LNDVFMADYEAGGSTWQGFLRPYASPQEAKAMFDKYLETVKADGAEVKTEAAKGCDAMVVSSNIGLVDVVFLKGNSLGGVNGATQAKPAVEFAKAFAAALPAKTPALPPMEKSAEGGHE